MILGDVMMESSMGTINCNSKGEPIIWEPYSKENISNYEALWKDLYDSTMKELKPSKEKDYFKDFYASLTELISLARQSIPELKKDFSKYLKETVRYDDTQVANVLDEMENQFKKLFIKHLEEKLNIKFNEQLKEVLAQYYATSTQISDWNNTIYIIELIKTVMPSQK